MAILLILALAADVVFNEARAVMKLAFELLDLIHWLKFWR